MATRDDLEDWLARTALGDRAAFARVYDHTSAKLFGVLLRVLKDRVEAEDALQDVFIKVWHGAKSYRANGYSPMTWLIAVTRNHAIDRLRRRQSAERAEETDAGELPDTQPGAEARMVAMGERTRINECFETLEPKLADAVRRAYLDGDSYAALAERFSVPLNTMRTWLRRSLLKLRECLEP